MVETFDNVWDALCDTPAQAADMTARSDLMLALTAYVKSWNLPEEAAAARLRITRSRLSDLLRGAHHKPGATRA